MQGTNGRLRINPTVSGNTDVALVKDGPGELALFGAGTWSGATVVHDGRLTLSNAAALPAGQALQVNSAGGMHPELNVLVALTTSPSSLLINNGKVLGSTSATMSTPMVAAFSDSELGLKIVGSSALTVTS